MSHGLHKRWRVLVTVTIGAVLCLAIVAGRSEVEFESRAEEPTPEVSSSPRARRAVYSVHEPRPEENPAVAAWQAEFQQQLIDYQRACGLTAPLDLLCDGELCAARAPVNEDRGLPYLKTLWRRPDKLLFRSLADWGAMEWTDTPCTSARMRFARRSPSPAMDSREGHEPPFCYVQHRKRTHPRYKGDEGERMAALCNALAEHHGDADRVRYLTPSEYQASVAR